MEVVLEPTFIHKLTRRTAVLNAYELELAISSKQRQLKQGFRYSKLQKKE